MRGVVEWGRVAGRGDADVERMVLRHWVPDIHFDENEIRRSGMPGEPHLGTNHFAIRRDDADAGAVAVCLHHGVDKNRSDQTCGSGHENPLAG